MWVVEKVDFRALKKFLQSTSSNPTAVYSFTESTSPRLFLPWRRPPTSTQLLARPRRCHFKKIILTWCLVESLEHEFSQCISMELGRVLRPGGVIAIIDKTVDDPLRRHELWKLEKWERWLPSRDGVFTQRTQRCFAIIDQGTYLRD